MCQTGYGQRLTLLSIAVFLLTCAVTISASAADYYKTPEYSTPKGVTVIHAGTLLAVPGQPPRKEQSIIVRAGKIVRIEPGYTRPQDVQADGDVRVVDLENEFVMPGFIDLHVHLSFQAGSSGKLALVTNTDADTAFTAQMYARRTLMAGFTTVRDLGSHGDAIFALRDAVKAGKVAGPKVLVAGDMISATGGHGDIMGFRPAVLAALPAGGVCDGADACRAAVRYEIKRGADVIKVAATGGVLDEATTGTGQQFTDEELRAIAETAHSLGRKVTAHAHAKAGIEAALRAGFDSIEHAMWADKDTMKLFKKTGAWLIPTVYPITAVGDTPEKVKKGPFRNLPPAMMEKLLQLGHQPKDMLRLALSMGVKVALGTDSGVSPHGENAHEFIEYVNAGMTPMEALKAGTVDAAEAGGFSDRAGSIEPGKPADIVAMPVSPLEDIHAVLGPDFVMRDGYIFKQSGQGGSHEAL